MNSDHQRKPRPSDPRTEKFLANLVGKSRVSIWTYRSAINKFLRYCGKREPSAELVQKWLAMLERNEKLSQNSIHFYGVVIKMYLRKTGRDVEKLDQISLPKQETPRREHIAAEDWETFLGAIDDEDDYMLFDLLLSTGMTVGGLLTLKPKNIKWRERRLLVYGTQDTPVIDKCLEELQHYIKKYGIRRGQIIFNRYTDKLIGEKLRLYAVKAGLKNAKKLTPHCLRHSFAIRFIQQSRRPSALEDLRRFLGHHTIATTQRYLDYSAKESQDAYEEVFAPNRHEKKR